MAVAADSYASIADIQARQPAAVLKQLAPYDAGVTPPTPDPGFDADKVQAALNDASSEINGYLAARYPLPLPSGVAAGSAAVLTRITVDIALYRLMGLRSIGDTEQSRLRYEDALHFLEKVNAGRLILGAAASQAPVDTNSGAAGVEINALIGLPVRTPVFNDSLMERFRCL